MKARYRNFRSVLADDIKSYLQYKRSVGRKFDTEESVLHLFDDYLVDRCITEGIAITSELISTFLCTRPRHQPRSYNHLLGVIRCFFQWLVVQDRLEYSPVRAHPKRTTAQRKPYLFDSTQIKRLLGIAAALPDKPKGPNRGKIYHLIFAMMYTLGLRVGETARLCHKDVDLHRQLLEIRETKFTKDRLVPFGPRLGGLLRDYLVNKRTDFDSLDPQAPLFSFNAGRAINAGTITQTFHHLMVQYDFTETPGTAPARLHCLRHSFAVGTLLRWYRAGIDPGKRLIHLSTFLGHVDPASTAWYLTITDELLNEANKRFEKLAKPMIRECSV